jgi:hypothetical protein
MLSHIFRLEEALSKEPARPAAATYGLCIIEDAWAYVTYWFYRSQDECCVNADTSPLGRFEDKRESDVKMG